MPATENQPIATKNSDREQPTNSDGGFRLNEQTPDTVEAALTDYIVGLRAVVITYRGHASNAESTSVAILYNQMCHGPPRIYDMED